MRGHAGGDGDRFRSLFRLGPEGRDAGKEAERLDGLTDVEADLAVVGVLGREADVFVGLPRVVAVRQADQGGENLVDERVQL
jgi:hypothetical protein